MSYFSSQKSGIQGLPGRPGERGPAGPPGIVGDMIFLYGTDYFHVSNQQTIPFNNSDCQTGALTLSENSVTVSSTTTPGNYSFQLCLNTRVDFRDISVSLAVNGTPRYSFSSGDYHHFPFSSNVIYGSGLISLNPGDVVTLQSGHDPIVTYPDNDAINRSLTLFRLS